MQKLSRNQKRQMKATTTVTTSVVPQVATQPAGSQRTRRRRRNRQRNRRLNQLVPCLSNCARLYARAVWNPFSFMEKMDGELPCVPSMPVRRTQKVCQWARGQITVGASGNAYVMMTPEVAFNDTFNPGAAVYPTVWFSTSNFSSPLGNTDGLGGFDDVGAVAAGPVATGSGTNLNGPFQAVDFSANEKQTLKLKYRIVGMGLRVAYRGTLLNRSGTLTTLEQPDHQDLQFNTLSQVRSFDQAKTWPMSDKWTYVTYRPASHDELDFREPIVQGLVYSTGVNSPPGNFDNSPNYVIGIAANGLQSGAILEYEAVQIVEYIGKAARAASPTTSDPIGLNAVLNANAAKGSGSRDHSPAVESYNIMETLNQIAMQSGPYVKAAVNAAQAVKAAKNIYDSLGGYPSAERLTYRPSVTVEDLD